MNNYSKHSKQDLENMKWLDLVAGNKESLHQRLMEIWQDSIGQPQVTATGKIDLNFNEILHFDQRMNSSTNKCSSTITYMTAQRHGT